MLRGLSIDNMFLHFLAASLLFVTLTFPDRLRSTREAHRRLNSFLKAIRDRYDRYIWILQPHMSGVIHYDLLLPTGVDLHDGTDLDAWSHRTLYTDRQRRQAMNPALQAESDWWETKAPAFSFGRVEAAPVYSNVDRVRNYLTRQDWRTWHWPFDETKSVRFWSSSRNARAGSVKFSWNTPGGRLCRARLRVWAEAKGCHRYEDLEPTLGKHWGYQYHCYLARLRDTSV